MSQRVRLEDHPPLTCWFCGTRHPALTLVTAGIIVSRAPRDGGPYRLVSCPACLTENMLESTRRGRWFSSPAIRVSFLDYVFSPSESGDRQSQLVLQAIAWLRENEERRRYFFERDGDELYSSRSILARFLPWLPERGASGGPGSEDEASSERERVRSSRTENKRRERSSGEATEDGQTRERPRPRRGGLLSPAEILGVAPDASPEEIKRRFHFLAIQYHPDKVHHLGADFREQAHLRFIELERAYRVLIARAADNVD